MRLLNLSLVYTLCLSSQAYAASQISIWSGTQQSPLISSDRCPTYPRVPDTQPPPSKKGQWLGWGADVYNNHWAASDATVTAGRIGELELTCSLPYNIGVSASALVRDGIAYYPTWGGLIVALNYTSCKEVWRRNVTKIIEEFKPLNASYTPFYRPVSRTTPVMDGDVLFFGTIANALVLAINKRTGKLIDSYQLGSHPLASITMSPTFYRGQLFVGLSSQESSAPAFVEGYQCCSFKGSMNALELRRGRFHLKWTQSMIAKDSNLSGAAVWGSQPAIDPIRQQVLIGTGQLYTLPPEFEACQNQTANITVIRDGRASDPCIPRNTYFDTVLALDLKTGFINWATPLHPLDAWNVACLNPILPVANPEACPANPGPDADFGMAPTYVPGSAYTPMGLDIAVIGQKNGNLYALSAQAGRLLWAIAASPGGEEGGLRWGIAVDEQRAYFTGTNSRRLNFTLEASTDPNNVNVSNSIWGAASLKDGSIIWQTPVPGNATAYANPALVNDVLLVGAAGRFNGSIFPPVVGPGTWTPLNAVTGEIIRTEVLDEYFQGSAAAVHGHVMFGTGHPALSTGNATSGKGSFLVWSLPGDANGFHEEQALTEL